MENKGYDDGLAELKRVAPIPSKDIKKEPNTTDKKSYKGSKKQRIKAWILAVTAATGLIHGAKEIIEGYGEYQYTAGTVDELNEFEIIEESNTILKKEISKATGVPAEDIYFTTELNGTTSYSEIINAGDKEFRDTVEFRSLGIFTKNTLKSQKLLNLIKAARGGTREELIKTLRDARKFSEEYELVEEDGVLKAKKVKSNDDANKDEKQKVTETSSSEKTIEDER